MASSDNNPIGWCDKTWNPVRGCSRVSPGCDNCYAMGQAHRYAGMVNGKPGPFYGLTTKRKGKVDWSGRVRFVPGMLDAPLRWREPKRIFVNSMSDLFHHSVTDAEIMRVWLVMARAYWHTFQILTKRADRMAEWVSKWCDVEAYDTEPLMARGPDAVRKAHTTGRARMFAEALEGMGAPPPGAAYPTYDWAEGPRWLPSVLPNVWLGVSCEDQQRTFERMPHLLRTPGAVRFISAEPLLGPIDFSFGGMSIPDYAPHMPLPQLDWLIVGGEAGPGARPCDVSWIESIVEQCRKAGVACYVKQLGAHVRDRNDVGFDGEDGDKWHLGPRLFDAVVHDPDGVRNEYQGAPVRVRLLDRAGKDTSEWPDGLNVRQFPGEAPMSDPTKVNGTAVLR